MITSHFLCSEQAVQPNRLTFAGTQNFTVDIWTYPADSGFSVEMNLCVGFFFFLSFVFQLCAMFCQPLKLGYWYLFPDSESGDAEHVSFVRTTDSTGKVQYENGETRTAVRPAEDIKKHLNYELRINWLRFVEYSGSGSLVLFTIAILAGVTDINLLVCMFVLSATCMLLGIVAEIILRIKNALKMFWVVAERGYVRDLETYTNKMGRLIALITSSPDKLTPTDFDTISKALGEHVETLKVCEDILKFRECFESIAAMLKAGFYLSHMLGWLCIAVPWFMVGMQLKRWYEPCDAESLAPPLSLLQLLGIEVTNTLSSQVSATLLLCCCCCPLSYILFTVLAF